MTLLSRLHSLPILFDPLGLSQLPTDKQHAIAQIDEILPQTQCGLCGHIDGCLPYAHGIMTANEAPNLCIPGGQAVTDKIIAVLNLPTQQTATPSKWQTDPTTHRPIEVRAVIDEDNCIGCTKCIPACPVDAIIGTAKHMHTIISELCTGCELCLPPCPVDCIRLVPHARTLSDDERQHEQNHLRHRYHRHLNRVAKSITDGAKPVVSSVESVMTNVIASEQSSPIDEGLAKNTIELAKLRTQIKKLTKQLMAHETPALRGELDRLTAKLSALQQSN